MSRSAGGLPGADEIAAWAQDARQRTLELVADLTDEQFRVPRLEIINPFQWEIGHVAWFQEKWVLRHAAGQPPLLAEADALYDSAAVHHDTRWDLLLPGRGETEAYLKAVLGRVVDRLRDGRTDESEAYFHLLCIFHEDMHDEAFTYTRQTLSYTAPKISHGESPAPREGGEGPLPGDVEVPGGTFRLGAPRGSGFVFDNEQWEHPVQIRPFAVARAAVTQGEFARFVDDGGYRHREFWSDEGWTWREGADAEMPVCLRRGADGRWLRRHFDQWRPLEPHRPVIHVNWHEANAYCRWAGRRLPTEPEWETAAAGEPAGDGSLGPRKRRFPWGDEPPSSDRANLDSLAMDTLDVGALPAGDSAFGCRQMIGNVWEWTSSAFLPYPGFEPGPYQEYSEPWFGPQKVLRGGAWTTRSRLIRNTWRNYYLPHRRDVLAGFRTCRLDG